jgi:hypothetical protein
LCLLSGEIPSKLVGGDSCRHYNDFEWQKSFQPLLLLLLLLMVVVVLFGSSTYSSKDECKGKVAIYTPFVCFIQYNVCDTIEPRIVLEAS